VSQGHGVADFLQIGPKASEPFQSTHVTHSISHGKIDSLGIGGNSGHCGTNGMSPWSERLFRRTSLAETGLHYEAASSSNRATLAVKPWM
jgi:hypothetical protein